MCERPKLVDLVAGLSVGVVVVPQSLGYAQVAGVPPVHGLYSAALPAVVAAFFVSSRYLQTGPVALTALLTFSALSSLAQPQSSSYVSLAALLALLVGVIRVLVGVTRLGRFAYLMSPQLLAGFVPAAGILIVASQIPEAIGRPTDGGVLRVAADGLAAYRDWDLVSVSLCVGAVALIYLGRRVSQAFPSVIAVVGGGIAFSILVDYSGPRIGTIPTGFPPFSLRLPWADVGVLLVPAIVIALVGFAEPASIARTLATKSRERWNPNQEFVSQGMAGITAGICGGFPVGGSFSRTNLIRLAGAETRWAGAVAGLMVLLALPFVGVMSSLPRAVLAGIVIASVLPLLRLDGLIWLWRISPPQAAIASATFASALVFAPHIEYAVGIGVVLSVLNHLTREFPLDLTTELVGDELTVEPRGVLWFGSAQTLEDLMTETLASHPDVKRLRLDLGGLGRIDLSGAIVLRKLVRDARSAQIDVSITGVPPRSARVVRAVMGGRI